MRFGSVCSGIEAASVAWHPLGWETAWLAEIEPFPSAVLAHHYPATPNLGDMTKIAAKVLSREVEAPDVLVGGTPCQAFSVAGAREGLADSRGQLTIKFGELADAIDIIRERDRKPPAVIVWENVPGVLSDKANAFGCFLGLLAGEDVPLEPPGGRWSDAGFVLGPKRAIAWRILDAQHFGLAQRRRRVFVVASARAGFDPRAVLFEFDGLRRDSAPSREAGSGVAAPTASGVGTCGADDNQAQAGYILAHGQGGAEIRSDGIAPTLTCNHEAPICCLHPTQDPISSDSLCHAIGTGSKGGSATAAVAIRTANTSSNGWGINTDGIAYTLDQAQGQAVAILGDGCLTAWDSQQKRIYDAASASFAPTLSGSDGGGGRYPPAYKIGYQVRRLTPTECERLQGFPDNYTRISWRNKAPEDCPDGPRYKALGNSKAVPVVRWIGARIQQHLGGYRNDLLHLPAERLENVWPALRPL